VAHQQPLHPVADRAERRMKRQRAPGASVNTPSSRRKSPRSWPPRARSRATTSTRL
jgi:hypothetical protein